MALEQIAADIEKLDYIQQPVIERAVSSEYNLKIQEIDDILSNGLAAVKPQNSVQINAQKLDSPLYDGDTVEANIKNQIGKNIIKVKALEHSLDFLTDQDLKRFTEDSWVKQKVEDSIKTYGLDNALLESQIKVDTLNTEIDGYYNQRSAITLGETISTEDIAEAKIRIQIAKNLIKVETLEHSLGYLTDQELKSSTEDSVVRQKVEDSINKYGLDSALLKSQTKVDTLNTEIDGYYNQRSAITLGETISTEEQLINQVTETHKNLGYFDFSDDEPSEMSVEEAQEYIEKVRATYGDELAKEYIEIRHRYSVSPDNTYTQLELIDIKDKMDFHIKVNNPEYEPTQRDAVEFAHHQLKNKMFSGDVNAQKNELAKSIIKESILEYGLYPDNKELMKSISTDEVIKKTNEMSEKYGIVDGLTEVNKRVEKLEKETDELFKQRTAICLGCSPEQAGEMLDKVKATKMNLDRSINPNSAKEISTEQAAKYVETLNNNYGSEITTEFLNTTYDYSMNPENKANQAAYALIKDKMADHIVNNDPREEIIQDAKERYLDMKINSDTFKQVVISVKNMLDGEANNFRDKLNEFKLVEQIKEKMKDIRPEIKEDNPHTLKEKITSPTYKI